MPEPIEPQLDELRRRARRRLIGAVVLALAAAVLVPMLLESDPKPLGEDVSVKIPPIDDSKFVSKLGDKAKAAGGEPGAARATPEAPKAEPVPAAAAPAAETAPPRQDAPPSSAPSRSLAQAEQRVISPQSRPAAAADGPAASSKTPAPAGAGSTGTAAEPPRSADSPKAAAAPKAPESPKGTEPAEAAKAGAGAYSVQLAAFADDKGANALAAKLKKAGHPAYTEPYETSRGRVWRVRVGPYPTREAAESARIKLKSEGHNGILAAAK
jgi:DedD protein